VNKNIYQQGNDNNSCKMYHQKPSKMQETKLEITSLTKCNEARI
jgi:hypothetical protein